MTAGRERRLTLGTGREGEGGDDGGEGELHFDRDRRETLAGSEGEREEGRERQRGFARGAVEFRSRRPFRQLRQRLLTGQPKGRGFRTKNAIEVDELARLDVGEIAKELELRPAPARER